MLRCLQYCQLSRDSRENHWNWRFLSMCKVRLVGLRVCRLCRRVSAAVLPWQARHCKVRPTRSGVSRLDQFRWNFHDSTSLSHPHGHDRTRHFVLTNTLIQVQWFRSLLAVSGSWSTFRIALPRYPSHFSVSGRPVLFISSRAVHGPVSKYYLLIISCGAEAPR